MVAAFKDTQDFKVGDRVRGNWLAARNKFGKVIRLYQKRRGSSDWWAEIEWDGGDSSKLRVDQIALADDGDHEQEEEVSAPDLRVGDKVRILYCEDNDPHNQQWCDRVGVVNRLHPNRASNQVQVDFNDQDREQHWAFDYALVELVERPGSETVSEVEELPILEAIASTEGGALESPEPTALSTAVAGGSAFLELASRINALDSEGRQAEQTAVAATQAALDLRRELGQWLSEAKTQIESELGYGQWGKWLLTNCPDIQPRMASTYMRLHQNWDYIQGQAGDEPLTLRGAIAILQSKPVLSAAPEAPAEPQKTFEEVAELFAPWGSFERTADPKFKFKATVWAGKEYFFRGFNEATRWHEEHCFDWNTIEARQRQAQQANMARTCVACKHRQLIGDGSEFTCNARGSSHGVRENLAPECRHYKTRFMDVPPKGAIASTPALEVRKHASGVVGNCDNLDEGPQAGDRVSEVLVVMPEYPAPHPAGVLASSARNGGDDDKDERYTPAHVWQACLKVVGADRFDLDPATNDRQSPNVPCIRGYTKQDDGLQQDWSSHSLWLNPPYSRMEEFVSKYLVTWDNERLEHGFLLAKGDFSTKWAQRLLKTCTVACFVNHRLTFLAPDKELETSFFASMLFYHGPNINAAVRELSKLGAVMTLAGGME